MIARLLKIACAAVIVIVVGLFVWLYTTPGATAFAGGTPTALSAYRGANPTGVPASLSGAPLAARGEYLTRAADCEACHTREGGKPFAGGRPFVLPFGTIWSTNITADAATGIGGYSDAQWVAMMRHGKRRDGQQLYPAMPFATYALMTDADALAIKAYLKTVSPVNAPTRPNTFGWPFDQRPLIEIWAWMFNPAKPFEPVAERSPQWNRGAYLVEAMAHCAECHTPRNLGFALNNREKFAGAVTGGWRAPNISSDKTGGIGGWDDAALTSYLSRGYATGHGVATGPMGEAVDYGLSHLTPDDIAAIVTYLRSVPGVAGPSRVTTPAPATFDKGPAAASGDRAGEKVFAAACASCHDWTGVSPVTPYATLTGVRSVNDHNANNVAQVVMYGVKRNGVPTMPAFGRAYSDHEIAAVANYVTARFGAKGAALDAGDIARLRRDAGH